LILQLLLLLLSIFIVSRVEIESDPFKVRSRENGRCVQKQTKAIVKLKSKVFSKVVGLVKSLKTHLIEKKTETLRWESDNYFLKCTSFKRDTPIAIPCIPQRVRLFTLSRRLFFRFVFSFIFLFLSTTKNVFHFFNFVNSPGVECLCFRIKGKTHIQIEWLVMSCIQINFLVS
jgi:hypothetical protein